MGQKFPVTGAIRVLRQAKIPFEQHLYDYTEKGGTAHSASELGVDEACVIKTLIMEDESRKPLVVLMDGVHEVSTKNLARLVKAKTIVPCKPDVANKHTGYLVGGTSPFGTKKKMPVYMEQGLLDFETVYINGGKRGFLVSIKPQHIIDILKPTMVEVGIQK